MVRTKLTATILAGASLIFAFTTPVLAQEISGGKGEPQGQTAAKQIVTLNDLIEEALRHNPEIRAAMRDVDAKRARVPQAGALPDPVISFGQMNEGNVIPFTTLGKFGFSEIYIGITQEFPFYGKRGLREQVAGSEADAEYWMFEFTRRQVIANVKSAYYDLFYRNKAQEIVEKIIALMENFARIAEALYSVGKGSQADVLRAQTEISRLQDRLEVLQQQRGISEAQINALLNRPADAPIGWPAPVEKKPFRYSLAELTGMALESSPLLKRERRLIDGRASALELAKKELYPDFGFVFTYHNRGALLDYWTIGGTAKIPLYFWRKQRRGVEEAAAELAGSRERYSSTQAMLLFRIKDHYLRASTSDRLTRLYGETIIPQETLTLEATTTGYEVGKIDFLSVIDSVIKLLNDELTYYEQLAEYKKALAQLELLVGIELTK